MRSFIMCRKILLKSCTFVFDIFIIDVLVQSFNPTFQRSLPTILSAQELPSSELSDKQFRVWHGSFWGTGEPVTGLFELTQLGIIFSVPQSTTSLSFIGSWRSRCSPIPHKYICTFHPCLPFFCPCSLPSIVRVAISSKNNETSRCFPLQLTFHKELCLQNT